MRRETDIPGTRGHLRLEEGVSARARGGAGSVLELETNLHEAKSSQDNHRECPYLGLLLVGRAYMR